MDFVMQLFIYVIVKNTVKQFFFMYPYMSVFSTIYCICMQSMVCKYVDIKTLTYPILFKWKIWVGTYSKLLAKYNTKGLKIWFNVINILHDLFVLALGSS